MEVIIRELKEEDLPQVKAIFGEFVAYHQQWDAIFEKIASASEMWGDYVYGSHTQDESCRVLIAERGGHIVGYCMGRIAQKPPIYQARTIGEIRNIAVKEGHKRQGIGGKLFTTIREWFTEHNVDHIEIEAATANPQSVGFWGKMGAREFIKKMEIRI
jgi:ribosomal protein S18 acetylase RimI-like enzyme